METQFSSLVVCPICGKKNRPEDTFRCRKCGKDNVCVRHQDEKTFLCPECALRDGSTINAVKPRSGLSEVRFQAMREKYTIYSEYREITEGPFISLGETERMAVMKTNAAEFHAKHPTWRCVPLVLETFSSWNPLAIPSGVKIVFGTRLDAYVEFKNKHQIHAVPFAAGMWSLRIRLYGWQDKDLSENPIFDKSFPLENNRYDSLFVQIHPGVVSVKPKITPVSLV